MNMRILTAVLAITLSLTAAQQSRAMTPQTPVNGTSTSDLHPLFTWALDDQLANTITVSRSSRVTPDGAFYDEDRVTGDGLQDADTSWRPTSAIPAGTYWWNLDWYAADYSSNGYTTPWSFKIPTAVHTLRLTGTQYDSLSDASFRVAWWSNTDEARLVCRIYRKRRVIARAAVAATYLSVGARNSATCDLRIKERFDGMRLRAVGVVVSGGVKRTVSKRFRAT